MDRPPLCGWQGKAGQDSSQRAPRKSKPLRTTEYEIWRFARTAILLSRWPFVASILRALCEEPCLTTRTSGVGPFTRLPWLTARGNRVNESGASALQKSRLPRSGGWSGWVGVDRCTPSPTLPRFAGEGDSDDPIAPADTVKPQANRGIHPRDYPPGLNVIRLPPHIAPRQRWRSRYMVGRWHCSADSG